MSFRSYLFSFVALALLLAPGCGSPPAPSDAGSDSALPDTGPECTTAMDCDDGLFCNGSESCNAGRCVLGTPMRCDDSVACTTDACSEELRRCVFRVPDADGDGAGDAHCVDATSTPLGTDCDDTDPNTFPTNPELCDSMAHDEDCDPMTHGARDADGDGVESSACCNGTLCGQDCDDSRRDVHPGAVEVCNGLDDDCNGMTDEGVTIDVYVDADHDGDGAMGATAMHACASTAGVSVYHTDCDDTDRTRSGRLVEVCDMVDNDCNGTVDDHTSDVTWYRDVDGDGFGSATSGTTISCVPPTGYSLLGTDCDDGTNTRSPARAEICDGLDDDCNGRADFVIAVGNGEDDDGDGIADLMCGAPYGHDCDDLDAASSPGTPETCDGRDNDCDMHVDEGATAVAFFRDADGDGWGSAASGTIVGCVPTAGFVRAGGDCDDANAMRYPHGVEGCNAIDDDCDGAIDEGSASAMCTGLHAQEACVVGICTQVACDSGYGDCTFTTAGCETSLTSDAANCGACGRACSGVCAAGSCRTLPFGLYAHYDAQVATSISTDTGGNVLVWHDVSGNGFDLGTASGNAVLRATGIGGHPAVDFAGAGMVTPSSFVVPLDLTVFFVTQEGVPEQWGAFAHHGSRDTDWSMEQNGDHLGTEITHFQSGNDNLGDDVTLVTGTNYILEGWISGADRNIAAYPAGGGAPMTATVNGTNSLSGVGGFLYVGASDNGEHSNAVIGEILYWARALTPAEEAQVVAYLRARWGI
jgi:hypothetical protein